MFFISKPGVKLSAFRVTAADFNGKDFDGSPFEGDVDHVWLQEAIKDGRVSLVPSRETDYAVWAVKTTDGEVVLASPGDYIIQIDDILNLYVCPGHIWKLLMGPEEKTPTDAKVGQPSEDMVREIPAKGFYDGIKKLDTEFDLEVRIVRADIELDTEFMETMNAWCDKVHLHMARGMNGPQSEWEELQREALAIMEGNVSSETKLPAPWSKAIFIVAGMVGHWQEKNPVMTSHQALDSLKTLAERLVVADKPEE